MSNPWELQPGETDSAFAAFCCYRDLGPTRSIRKAMIAAHTDTANIRLWEKWSADFDWVARALAYDAHIDAELREATLEQQRTVVREMGNRITERLLSMVGTGISTGDLPRWVSEWAKLARLLTGDVTDRTEVKGEVADDTALFRALIAALAEREPPAGPDDVPAPTGADRKD